MGIALHDGIPPPTTTAKKQQKDEYAKDSPSKSLGSNKEDKLKP